ncbi:hypothetical protein BTM25_48000 [Actinomadura rubteroloni]|uniref:Uncharacterized protein n=1 Tax=Actinomadura rubteroloni TaxID=1926885 RepID=A0A2P4UF31_9ACTN|nr:hypothetical protein BTM25_48000 [Actinomadura rubteroloni]
MVGGKFETRGALVLVLHEPRKFLARRCDHEIQKARLLLGIAERYAQSA